MTMKAGNFPLSGARRTSPPGQGRDPPLPTSSHTGEATPSSSSSSGGEREAEEDPLRWGSRGVRVSLSAAARRILAGPGGRDPPADEAPPPLTYSRSGLPTLPGEDGRALKHFLEAASPRPPPRARPAPLSPSPSPALPPSPTLVVLPGGRGEDTA